MVERRRNATLAARQTKTATSTQGDIVKRIAIVLVTILACASGVAAAHSGGTDRQGCHVDHSTGIRHCH
ncbi:YHYH domain-containing protein [Cupriavidus sp. H18C2]|uniref:YHYH domain-containing protein n=1 Tax=Cupriavidus sp. H18C2 TaxID=3241602 RepID=UPI003BF8B3E9